MIEPVRMHVWTLALALSCVTAGVSAQVESTMSGQTLHMLTGSQRELRLDQPLERVAIGSPGIADALLLKSRGVADRLLIVAKKPGSSSIMVWTQGGRTLTYTVRVEAEPPQAGSPDLSVRGDSAVLSGTVKDVYTLARAQSLSKSAGQIVDDTALNVPGTVQVDVRVVDFSRSVLKEVGLSLRSGFRFGRTEGGISSGGDIQNPISSAFSLLADWIGVWGGWNLEASLGLMQSNGLARVLAEPSLVALSGQSANFLAGGELPVPVPGSLGTAGIEYKSYGISLMVSPTILSENRIALKVAPEASDLDFSNGVTLSGSIVPAIVTRRANTTVELNDGESFVIGGLVSRSTMSNLDKVPFLGDLPILGSFFKHLKYSQDERELAIIVTPHIVRPLARNAPIGPMLPGYSHDTRDAAVWRPFFLGVADTVAMPGFSR